MDTTLPGSTVRPATRLVLALAGALLAAVPAAAAGAVPTTEVDPSDLPRGADVAIPHLEGTTFVDGDRRVPIDAEQADLLGASGRSFIIQTWDDDVRGGSPVLRLRPDDTVRPLLRASPSSLTLAEDGRQVVRVRLRSRSDSPVGIYSARSGKLLRERSFRNYPSVLGMTGHRVLMSNDRRGTFWWNTRTRRTWTITHRFAGAADLAHDLLATFTRDPYLGGCTVLSRLSHPGRTLWRSCTDRVASFDPDGSGIATTDILSDGVGPNRITTRTVRGKALARYVPGQWFGQIRWEDPGTVLLDTNGRTRWATVRCRLTRCENASDPEPASDLRTALPLRTSGWRSGPTR